MIGKIIVISAFVAFSIAQQQNVGTAENVKPEEQNHPPQPYDFAYESKGEHGSIQFRKESGDGDGKVSGSYGYKDERGIERIVEYVADKNGYRANVKTNEPGTESKNPANVELYADPIVIDYTPKPEETTQQSVTDTTPVQPHDRTSPKWG